MSKAMTPKTQSVCKHCQQEIVKPGFYWVLANTPGGIDRYCERGDANGTHEPVAEPASTGERPPVTEMYLCETERLFLKPNQLYRFIIHETCVRCNEMSLIGKYEAARPSEPSAPRKSVFDDFCEGCANEMAGSIKGRCLVPSAPQTSAEPRTGWIITTTIAHATENESFKATIEAHAAVMRSTSDGANVETRINPAASPKEVAEQSAEPPVRPPAAYPKRSRRKRHYEK